MSMPSFPLFSFLPLYLPVPRLLLPYPLSLPTSPPIHVPLPPFTFCPLHPSLLFPPFLSQEGVKVYGHACCRIFSGSATLDRLLVCLIDRLADWYWLTSIILICYSEHACKYSVIVCALAVMQLAYARRCRPLTCHFLFLNHNHPTHL